MAFSDVDKKEFQKMIVIGVGQALEDMVLPRFDQIDKKFENIDKQFEEVRNDISKLQSDVSRIERKLDNVTDHQAEKLDDHERRLKLVEAAMVV